MYCENFRIKKIFSGLAAFVLIASLCAGCGKEKMTEDAQAVQDMISELPDTYSAEADEEISSARAAYDNLSEEEKNTVDISVLNNLEQAEAQAKADEINKLIDEIKISNTSYNELSKSKTEVSKIMDSIADLPAETDNLIKYDQLLEKIDDIANKYAETVLDADNDINAMNDIMTNLNSINNSYSSASKYGYACDIATEVSGLSAHLSSIKSGLSAPVSDLKDACLYGEDYEIALAAIDVIQAIPESATDFYTPYLNASDFVDDCLKWQQIVQQKIDDKNEKETENHE